MQIDKAKGWLSSVVRTAALPVAIAISAGALGACTAEVVPAEAPVGYYEDYPSTSYEGRTVFYIDGRWTYRDGNRWYYYHHVPRALEARRATLRAAPAHHNAHGGGPREWHR